jgi:hypothetical protein
VAKPTPHLVGAYGMFWERAEVNWYPGAGPAAWQLLGRVNRNTPQVRVCDFRKAQGFYVLFDDFRANYVGLARGAQGVGSRLRMHDARRPNWSRFCWFAFDDVRDAPLTGWSVLHRRDALKSISSERVLAECEALLIAVLGSRDQNQMRFQQAKEWEQLRESDFLPGGLGRKVASDGYTDGWLRGLSQGAAS